MSPAWENGASAQSAREETRGLGAAASSAPHRLCGMSTSVPSSEMRFSGGSAPSPLTSPKYQLMEASSNCPASAPHSASNEDPGDAALSFLLPTRCHRYLDGTGVALREQMVEPNQNPDLSLSLDRRSKPLPCPALSLPVGVWNVLHAPQLPRSEQRETLPACTVCDGRQGTIVFFFIGTIPAPNQIRSALLVFVFPGLGTQRVHDI